MGETFLRVKDLDIHYVTSEADVYAVNGLSLDLQRGQTLGLVGETGAGKTTVARAILSILPKPAAKVRGGEVIFEGRNIYDMTEKEVQSIRGNKITMIFQDPMTALNPTMTVGDQIAFTELYCLNVANAIQSQSQKYSVLEYFRLLYPCVKFPKTIKGP